MLAHGSGSCADFVRRAFGPALAEDGIRLVAVEDRSGDVDAVRDLLLRTARAEGADLLGGISLGEHAAVGAALELPGLAGLLLALPAWTGPPGAVAALSGLAADEIVAQGLTAALSRIAGGSWVGEELAAAWPGYGEASLVAALRRTARSAGPTLAELATVDVPAGLVAFATDPFHPVATAREWADALPHAALTVLADDAPETDRSVIGRSAMAAWRVALSRRQGSSPG